MNHSKYPIKADAEKHIYEFLSEGPTGKIKKYVLYEKIHADLFNLGFGDWNEQHQTTDDSSRTNNGDRDKVLATVASTALDFTDKYRHVQIFTEGSTPSRTRLYQMAIAANWKEVSEIFEVQGYINGKWEVFQRGMNYEAFLTKRK